MKTIEPAEWAGLLEGYRGEITVVNCWATWCRPCLEFFPSFAGLRERDEYGDIEFVSVVVEDPADAAGLGEAKRLVVELEARFPHFAIQTDVEETLGLLGVDDLPAVLIYDAEGRLRYRIEGDAFEDEIPKPSLRDEVIFNFKLKVQK